MEVAAVSISPRLRSRVEYLDAVRGLAMCCVCISHLGQRYLFSAGAHGAGIVLIMVGMLATPTFMLVSGMLLGYTHRARSESFPGFRAKLVDRGVFLIVVGHCLVMVPHAFAFPRVGFWDWFFVTDVIGLAAISGPWLVPLVRQRLRIALSATVYSVSVVLGFIWTGGGAFGALKEVLVGTVRPHSSPGYYFPILPWVGLYLAGTVLGEKVLEWRASEGDIGVMRRALASGCGLVVVATIFWRMQHLNAGMRSIALAHSLTDPWQKAPPGPTYLLMQSGLALVLLGVVIYGQKHSMLKHVVEFGVTLGRASFFVFMLQFYVYFGIGRFVSPKYASAWPLLFLLSMAVLYAAAWVWNRWNGNKYLTVGLYQVLTKSQESTISRRYPA